MVKMIIKRDLKQFFPQEFSNRRLIGQFLDYVMNHFFQTSDEKEVNGYIGKKTVAMNSGDYYIEEPTPERQNYQLTPSLVTNNANGEINIVDYCDFINSLKLQGVDTNNINRIIDGKYWSWSPLINIDMFLNYNYYYWVEEGPTPFVFEEETDAKRDIIGKQDFSYTYKQTLGLDVVDTVLTLSSGMRIMFTNDVNTEFNNNIYIVEGVGDSIQLIEDNDSEDINTIPDYYVMERGCKDGNKWSKRNRWFHRTLVAKGDTATHYKQAQKPIICFNKDIELYNYGTYNRGYVDFVYYGNKNDIHGKSFAILFQGTRELNDGDKILILNDEVEENSNMVYEVSGKNTVKTIILQPIFNGLSTDGKPVKGEGVLVKSGAYAGQYFYYNGSEWIIGQEKTDVNQSPLFKLFDINKIELDNSLFYPQSSFKGSKLFDYKQTNDDNAIIDTDLGKKILTNGYGNYTFVNCLNNDVYYYVNNDEVKEEIKGYKFIKINGLDQYLNDWHLSMDSHTQYISTEIKIDVIDVHTESYEVSGHTMTREFVPFELSYKPIESNVRKSLIVYLNGNILNQGLDYILDDKTLKILTSRVKLKIDDYLCVKILIDGLDDTIAEGYYYDLPLSLTANPLNKDIEEINYNECFDQMTSIISNQKGFTGNSSGNNNYLNTKKDLTLGTEIIQNSRQLLKTMLLNSNDDTNICNAINYASNEYTKFKAKFRNVIETMSKTNEYQEYEWVQKIENGASLRVLEETKPFNIVQQALSKMNVGKEGLNSFYNNGVGSNLGNAYIPATPAYLGIDNCYKPRITTVEDEVNGNTVLLCHDGSYQMLFGDYRDNALLEIENQIYQSISQEFIEKPIFNKYKIIPGKFRQTDYSYEEFNNILTPFFEKWCSENNYEYMINQKFNNQDPFTWNYSGCYDTEGNQLKGSYKAIYMYYYDTYRPHTHPWEMLGFGDKPEWWEEHYGKAPYTSSNIPMWKDIENGYIVDGDNQGYHQEFERKGLIEKYLPVDESGNLLTPFMAGIVEKNPIAINASKNWESGDMGMIETMWHYTSDYRYALQNALYIMKPIQWVEENWETLGKKVLFEGTSYEQLVYTDTRKRTTNDNTIIHNEIVDDKYVKKIGIQQWISDYLVKQNLDITDYLGNPYRNIDIRLFYRCGAFYKKNTITIQSDNYGIIPENNVHMNIHKSLTDKILAYSAIIIVKNDKGYMIDGYNVNEPYFMVKNPIINGKKTAVEINGKSVVYYNQWDNSYTKIKYKTTYTSVQELFTIICGYGKYLEDNGVEFITINDDSAIIDFNSKAEDFLRWTSIIPESGQIIILNPASNEIRIHHNGILDKVGRRLNGNWTVLGTSGKPIFNEDLQVYRHQTYTDIFSEKYIMTMFRVNCVNYEHSLLFDNETIYGDVLYDSLLCVKTQRFKLNGVCANGWDGTLYAPGYLVQNDGCVSNYDKLADDFNYMYDTDDIRTFGDYRNTAMQTIGYRESKTMRNLLLNNRNMFDFYKGLLNEKGTKRSFGKLNRSEYIMSSNDSKIDLYDNWAFKIGEFGYTTNSSTIELSIPAEKITQNPQIISFSTNDSVNDNPSIINIGWSDNKWLKRIDNKDSNGFDYGKKCLNPMGGFLQINDVDYIVADLDGFDSNKDNMKIGETIWVVKTSSYDWNVYKKIDDEQYISMRVDNIKKLSTFDTQYLTKDDLVFVTKDILTNYEINDPQNLLKKSENITDDKAWSIFKYNGKNFELYRVQSKTVDIKKLNKLYIINDLTDETISSIQLFDPLQGIVPNNVLDEVNYITSYDPVTDYNDYYKWGDIKVGYLWWDTSKVRYLDYHQGEINYKRDNWGKQLPGSEIAIMEWVCSSSLPKDVTKYVHKEVWNSKTLKNDDYYYYWVKNPIDIPDVSFRTQSALNISNIINNPTNEGIIWFAPIDVDKNDYQTSTFILANFDLVTTGTDFVIQMNFKEHEDLNNHTEWLMVREGDDDEIPSLLWSKMKDSLIGIDNLGQIVPDPTLNDKNKTGLQLRPRQSMFKDMINARKNFVDICNEIFSSRDVMTTADVGTNAFNEIFLDDNMTIDYDYSVKTHNDLKLIEDTSLIGKTILVEKDEDYDNIWTLWIMNGKNDFELKAYQLYNVTKYWNYTDLYKDNTTYLIQPEMTFNTEALMNEYLLKNNIMKDSYFKYYNNYGKWVLVQYVGKSSTAPILYNVGIEDGALELNDLCYSFLEDSEILNDTTIFIDGMTKYQYLLKESQIVVEKILQYFENY